MKRLLVILAALAAPFAPAAAFAQATAAPTTISAPDYAQDGSWLCRPDRADACTFNQDVTVIQANGKSKVVKFRPDAQRQFDCFYVYPTVSLDPLPNSDMNAGVEERNVAAFQAARFAQHCRVYAPIYRQGTLMALRSLLTGGTMKADYALAYNDVKAAWDSYLARDNRGRGVVLIGHSQGASILKSLITNEIDGKPVMRQIVSAMLLGTNLAVPQGQVVGGDFKRMALCTAPDQFGCAVAYVTFRADSPPPAGSRFGVVPTAGQVAACVNPAALGGGKVVTDAILGTKGAGAGSAAMGPWTSDGAPVLTSFVKVPGLISAECRAEGGFSYLAVTVNADPRDPRTDTIVGDVALGGTIDKAWGLHLIDMGVEMGNLVDLTDRQAAAWRGTPRPKKR